MNKIPIEVANYIPVCQRKMDNSVDGDGLENTYLYLDNVTIGGVDQVQFDYHVEGFS